MGEGTKAKRCNTCAKRKIACDLKDPACSQCLLTGRECPGYHQPHVFLHQAFGTPSAKSGKQKVVASRVSRGKSQKAGLQKASSSTTGHRPIHHRAVKYTISNIAAPALSADGLLIQLIIGNFASSHEIGLVHIGDNSLVSLNSRMCGAWVTLLPELFAKSATGAGVLCIGARALGTAISGRLEKDESLIAESLDLVCRGLRALRELLISQEGASDVEVLSASMCLKITEVLLGTSHNGWSVHIHGIAELIKDRGPCNFVIGTAHQLFASFRIFLLLEYMQKRKSTFLASPEWLKVPFCNRSKSSMQTLLDAASPLPGLLEKVDKFRASQSVIEDSTAHEIHLELNAVVKDLRKWETDLTSALEGSLWWPVSSPSSENTNSVDEEAGFTIFYQFANILTANTMCHYWAFLVIALSEISLLEPCIQPSLWPYESLSGPRLAIDPSHCRFLPSTQNELSTLSSNICASMRYHMHPSQKLYGPASIFFPLWIALQFFEQDPSPQSKRKELWCRSLFRELEERGLPLAKHLPGCRPGL